MRLSTRVLLALLLLNRAGPTIAGPVAGSSSAVLVLIGGVPAFESTRRGFLEEAPGAVVVEMNPDLSNARALLEPIRTMNPSVVVALGSAAAMAVHQYLPTSPKVFGLILQPRLLAQDEGMRGGFTLAVNPELRVEALGRLFKPLRKVAILSGPDGGTEARELAAALSARGVDAMILPAGRAGDINSALQSLDRATQALLLTTEGLFLKEEVTRALIRRTLEAGVPVVGFSERTVRLGGLAAVEIDYVKHGAGLARAAAQAAASRAATDPGFSPANEYHCIVNRETARTLGITLPSDLPGEDANRRQP